MDEKARLAQKKLIGTIGGIVLIYLLKNVVIPYIYNWWVRRKKQADQLKRLAARRGETKAQKEQLEKELAEEEELVAKEKKEKDERKRNKVHDVSENVPKFQFPKATTTTLAQETLTSTAPAPASRPIQTNSGGNSMASTAPTRTSNPWASTTPTPTSANSFTAERVAQDAAYYESARVDSARIKAKQDAERRTLDALAIKESLQKIVPKDPGESSGEDIVRFTFKLSGFGVKDKVKFQRRFRRIETTTDVINFWKAHALVEAEDMDMIEVCTQYPGHPVEPDVGLSTFSPKEAFIVRLKRDT